MFNLKKNQSPQKTTQKPNQAAKNTQNSATEDIQLPEPVKALDEIHQESLKAFEKGQDCPKRWIPDTLENRAAIMDFLILKIIMAFFFNQHKPRFYLPKHNIFYVKKKADCRGFEEPRDTRALLFNLKDEEAIGKKRRELLKNRDMSKSALSCLKRKKEEIYEFLRGLNLKRLRGFVETRLSRDGEKVQLPCFKFTINFQPLTDNASEGDLEDPSTPLTFSPVKNLKKQKIIRAAFSSSKKNKSKKAEIGSPIKRLKVASKHTENSLLNPSENADDESKPSSAPTSQASRSSPLRSKNKKISLLTSKINNLSLKEDKAVQQSFEVPKNDSEVKSDGSEPISSQGDSSGQKSEVTDLDLNEIKALFKTMIEENPADDKELKEIVQLQNDIERCETELALLRKEEESVDGLTEIESKEGI